MPPSYPAKVRRARRTLSVKKDVACSTVRCTRSGDGDPDVIWCNAAVISRDFVPSAVQVFPKRVCSCVRLVDLSKMGRRGRRLTAYWSP